MDQLTTDTEAGAPMEPGSPAWRRALIVCSMAALVWAVGARVLGPSDTWDQRQPRTVSYTTDIAVNGGSHWLLPIERGEYPATKPPLYNWLAVPMVKLMGFSSDLAHKWPSVAALCLCWLVVVRLGRRLDAGGGETLGWLAGMMLVANYTFFKLGYLARPDMLLTLWLLLGWIAATRLLIDAAASQAEAHDTRRMTVATRRLTALGFWLCVGLAGLTKGPAALILPLYAIIAGEVIASRWRWGSALPWWYRWPVHWWPVLTLLLYALLLYLYQYLYAIIAGEVIPGWWPWDRAVPWWYWWPVLMVGMAVIAREAITGRGRILGWWWGLPLSLILVGLWVWGVWLVDPEHLKTELWYNEIWGRVTGLGPEGSHEGPIGLLKTAPYMVWYYLGRFAPWSVLSILAVVALWSRVAKGGLRRWRALGAGGAMLHGAALFVIITIALYSLSASKRADYIAAASPPGALLAAWWLLRVPPGWGITAPWLAPTVTAVVLASLTTYNQLQVNAPQRGFGDAINRFIKRAEAEIQADSRPVAFWAAGRTHLQSYLGSTGTDASASVRRMIDAGRPFWLITGERSEPPVTVHDWLRDQQLEASLTEACRSEPLARTSYWPGEVVLYRVDPAEPR